MAGTVDWRERKYREVYEEEMRGLERRRDYSREELEGLLLALYQMEGADWGGRGEVQDTALSASIAAYEDFLSRRGEDKNL
jgi:hypothetical protein